MKLSWQEENLENEEVHEMASRNKQFRMRVQANEVGKLPNKFWKISLIYMKLATLLISAIPFMDEKGKVTMMMKTLNNKRPT